MENKQNNLTVWQRLSQAFGPNSLLNQDYPTYKFDKEQLLKTTSKQDYDREKLQAQQTYYLANQWTKIESNLYTQAVYYEPTRLASFYDYESMEFNDQYYEMKNYNPSFYSNNNNNNNNNRITITGNKSNLWLKTGNIQNLRHVLSFEVVINWCCSSYNCTEVSKELGAEDFKL